MLAAGCGGGAQAALRADACAADTDCADGFYCDEDESRCEEGCRLDPDDCNPGSTCDPDTRACQGDACEDNGDCNPGQFCDLLEDPPACVPGCNNDDGCRGDLGCDLLLNACRCEDAGDDCFLDQVCFLGRCSDECTLDSDCADGFVCNTDDGICESTCEDDDNEPNNAPEEAISIDAGSYDHRMCYQAIEGFEWGDCFSIQMRFDEVLRVELSFDDNIGDLDLRLFDPDLLFVDVSDTGTGNEGLAYLARDNGRHVFCVEPKGEARYEMDYGLEVAVDDAPLPCLEDFNEAIGDNSCNEARQNPIALAIDEPVFLDGRSICEGDEDFFAMRVRPGQVLSAILERGDGVAPLDIEVLDADCSTVLAQSDTFGPVRNLEYSVDVEGDVYVRVFTEDPLLTADYSLTITAEAGDFLCPEDVINNVPLEPNDTPDQATILNLERGETETIEDLFTCFDDVDLYSVLVLNRFDTITANLTQSADAPPLALAVLGEDGEQVLVQNLDPTEIKTVETPGLQPGNYYVRVTSFAEDFPPAGVNYDLDVLLNTDQFCLDDGFEPNNSIEAATPIIEGQTDAVSCRLENSESDVYKVALNTGDRVRISIIYDHTRIAPLDALPTILYGPGGLADFRDFTIRDGDTDSDLFTVPEFVVPSTDVGDWFIEVGAGDTGLSVDYSIIVEIEQPDCDDTLPELFEPNEDCAGAFELALGERLNGFICGPTGDEDFFEIDTEPGQSLLLRAEYFHFDGNLDMEVFELDTFVGGSYQVGPNFEQVQVDNTSGGTYCVRIFTDGELTQNSYSIEATIE